MNSANFPERKKRKQEEAAVRQAAYDKLSPATKLAQLDKAFGAGLGAQRERKRLTKALGGLFEAPAEPGAKRRR